MKHKGGLSISRPSYGDGRKKVSIRLSDKDAVIEFVEIEIDYDKFTEALTGMGETECDFEVRALHNVGKIREHKAFEFPIPKTDWSDRKEVVATEAQKHCPDGWIADTYFGSRNSFFEKDGQNYARTTIKRWVDKEDE